MSVLKSAVIVAMLALCGAGMAADALAPEGYVGRTVCATCHEQQTARWADSHHDLAMQPASDETVLGDFNDASVVQHGVKSSFFREDGRFMVRTGINAGATLWRRINPAFHIAQIVQPQL